MCIPTLIMMYWSRCIYKIIIISFPFSSKLIQDTARLYYINLDQSDQPVSVCMSMFICAP